MHGLIYAYVHGLINVYVHGLIYVYVHGLINVYVHGFIYVYVHGLIYVYVHGLIYVNVHGLIYVYVHGLICLISIIDLDLLLICRFRIDPQIKSTHSGYRNQVIGNYGYSTHNFQALNNFSLNSYKSLNVVTCCIIERRNKDEHL